MSAVAEGNSRQRVTQGRPGGLHRWAQRMFHRRTLRCWGVSSTTSISGQLPYHRWTIGSFPAGIIRSDDADWPVRPWSVSRIG